MGYLSTGVYEAQKTAIKVLATVEEIETKSRVSRVAPQERALEYEDRQQVRVSFEIDGELRHSTLLDSQFDPDSSWLQYADFDRHEYPASSQVDVLVRRDLGYAATNASVIDSYYLSVLIASFGCVIFVIVGFTILLSALVERRRSSMTGKPD